MVLTVDVFLQFANAFMSVFLVIRVSISLGTIIESFARTTAHFQGGNIDVNLQSTNF